MPVIRFFRSLLVVLGLAMAAVAFAATEPTVAQIYDTAQAGRVGEAQSMIEQVLQAHPKSAKAHFVQAELFAVQGRLPDARKSLEKAEALAPGLPFAKPAALSALRERLAQGGNGRPAARPGAGSLAADAGIGSAGRDVPAVAAPAPAAPAPVESHAPGTGFSFSAVKVALIAAGLGLIWFLWRRRPAPPAGYGTAPMAPAGYPGGGPVAPGGVAQPGAGSGILGGLATGLAVGAGVVAAEQIGRRLFEHDRPANDTDRSGSGSAGSSSGSSFVPMDANADMGGTNFGINDASSWDDGGGGGGSDGGGDWDT